MSVLPSHDFMLSRSHRGFKMYWFLIVASRITIVHRRVGVPVHYINLIIIHDIAHINQLFTKIHADLLLLNLNARNDQNKMDFVTFYLAVLAFESVKLDGGLFLRKTLDLDCMIYLCTIVLLSAGHISDAQR